jgi:hypothetical protein
MGALDLPEQSREIGGAVYTVMALPTRRALQVMARVLKMAAPAFGDVNALELAAEQMGAFIGAVTSLAGELDESVLLFLCESFADVSRVHATIPMHLGKNAAGAYGFDDHFRGKLPDLFEWLKFAVEVTYGPLVPWLKSIAAKATAEAEAKRAADAAKAAEPAAAAA